VLSARAVPRCYKEDNLSNQVSSIWEYEEKSQRQLVKGRLEGRRHSERT
jgi:hypothetical protein